MFRPFKKVKQGEAIDQSVQRIILHIGRHKSGTSSLQHYFTSHADVLDDQGVLYPMSGRQEKGYAHHEFAKMCHRGVKGNQTVEMIVEAMKQEVRPHHHTILLSSEEFQNLSSTRWVKYFIEQFPGVDVDIICYVREFADYMVSSFRQAVQNQTNFRTFSTFCENRYPAKGFIRRWRKIGDLKLGWFHPNLLKNKDIVSDFLDKVGMTGPQTIAFQNRNPSLGGNLLWMKMAANHNHAFFLPYGDMTELMLSRPEFVKPFYFSDERADALRYKSSYNRTFEKVLGPVPFKSWENGMVLPDTNSLEEDLAFINEHFPYCDMSKMGLNPALGKDWF